MIDGLIFRQLFESVSCTYTYLIADPITKDAVIIDPVLETADRDANLIKELGLSCKVALNTHSHADHVTGTGKLKKSLPGLQSFIAKASGSKADIFIEHGGSIRMGSFVIECRATPGHTDGCITFVLYKDGVPRLAFTGDTVLIRGCGRTDFAPGKPEVMFNSIHQQIYSLPDHVIILPGHDYKGLPCSTVGEEKVFNARTNKGLDEFKKIMANLGLALPRQVALALALNPRDGEL